MKVGRKVTNYDITLNDKDIAILIECIQKAKLVNCRHQNHADALLEGFVKIFLDDNCEKYVSKYLELVGIYLKHNHKIEDNKIEMLLNKTREEIEDDKNYVFHYDPVDWAEHLVKNSGVNTRDNETIVEGKFADEIRKELLKKPSAGAIARSKRASELLDKLRR